MLNLIERGAASALKSHGKVNIAWILA